MADLATERERQLTTARANQTTGLSNGKTANWAPEVVFSPFRALSRRQLTFPSCCEISLLFKGSRCRLCRPLCRHHQRDHSVPRKKKFYSHSCFVLLCSTPKY